MHEACAFRNVDNRPKRNRRKLILRTLRDSADDAQSDYNKIMVFFMFSNLEFQKKIVLQSLSSNTTRSLLSAENVLTKE